MFCHYRLDAAVPETWKPNRSHMAIRSDASGTAIVIYVDPDHPDAWRSEPYYSDLKTWAQKVYAARTSAAKQEVPEPVGAR